MARVWLVFQIVTDQVSMERLLGQSGDLSRPQPVEYCVVCGDKASGTQVYCDAHVILFM